MFDHNVTARRAAAAFQIMQAIPDAQCEAEQLALPVAEAARYVALQSRMADLTRAVTHGDIDVRGALVDVSAQAQAWLDDLGAGDAR